MLRVLGVRASWLLQALCPITVLTGQSTTEIPRGELSAPKLVVDGAAAELDAFFGLAVLQSKGLIGIGEPVARRVVLLEAATGEKVGQIGRPGEGPGEISVLSSFGVFDDAFWVSDAGLARLSAFTAAGRSLWTVRIPSDLRGADSAPIAGAERLVLSVLGVRSAESILSKVYVKHGEPPAWFRRGHVPIVETDRRGRLLRVLAWEKVPTGCDVVYPVGKSWRSIAVPFCAAHQSGISRNGKFIAIAEHGTASMTTTSFRVTLVGPGSDTAYSRTLTVKTARLPQQSRDSALQAVRRSITNATHRHGGLQPEDRRALASLKIPNTLPAFSRVVVAEDGVVWLRLESGAPKASWLALDPKGRPVGRFDFPDRSEPVASEGQDVWVARTDRDDVPTFLRYQFR